MPSEVAPSNPLQILRLSAFDMAAYILSPKGEREHTHNDGFNVTISIGRRGLDERGFVVEVHELIERVKDSFDPHGSLGPQPERGFMGRRQDREFVASCEQLAEGVARVCYDMLEAELAEVTVSIKTRTGMATLEWKVGDPIPEFPKLRSEKIGISSDSPRSWTRHFTAFDVAVLIGDNFRCGTPDGVEDSFRCEVSLQRRGLDGNGVVVNGPAFKQAVLDHFHPTGELGTPNAIRTQGGSRVFVASCERLAAGVAFVAHSMLADALTKVTVSVQNATGMVTYTWREGDATPIFPSIASRELTDATYVERQRAIREGRSASSFC